MLRINLSWCHSSVSVIMTLWSSYASCFHFFYCKRMRSSAGQGSSFPNRCTLKSEGFHGYLFILMFCQSTLSFTHHFATWDLLIEGSLKKQQHNYHISCFTLDIHITRIDIISSHRTPTYNVSIAQYYDPANTLSNNYIIWPSQHTT